MRTVDRKAVAEKIFEEVANWLSECPVDFSMDDDEIWERVWSKMECMEDEAGDMRMEEERERKWEEEND